MDQLTVEYLLCDNPDRISTDRINIELYPQSGN